MTTTNATTANLYPFLTKNQIKERLNDRAFQMEAMVILLALQTQYEQDTSTTLNKNRQGFMSSHAVNGTRVAKKILAGEALDAKDEGHLASIAPRYSRQLAVYFRAKAIAEQPALKALVALFFSAAPTGDDAAEGDEGDAG